MRTEDTRLRNWGAEWTTTGFSALFEKARRSQTCGRGVSRRNGKLAAEITRPAAHAAKPHTVKRRRLVELAKRQHKRDRYYETMVQKIENDEKLPRQSPWVTWHVGRRTTK